MVCKICGINYWEGLEEKMAEIFSEEWMKKYKSLWNSDNEHIKQLSDSDFSSNVAFGLIEDESPRIVIEIHQGIITNLAAYTGQNLDWDVRGKPAFWQAVSKQSPSLMKLGLAYTSRELKFLKGDYVKMIKEPRLSNAFIKCFKFMSAVYN
jgi:hypothetical protein